MKKLSAILVGMSLVAGVVMAAGPVTSVNGVGYESFSVKSDKSIFIRVDFLKVGGGAWTVYDLFGTNFSHDVYAYYWDPSSGWLSENFYASEGIWDPGTIQFNRGDAIFLAMGGNGSVTNTITISGEIPGANNQATNSVISVGEGLNTVGYGFPSAIGITNTTLSSVAGGQDMFLYYWDTSSGWLSVNWYSSENVWDPDTFVLQPGQGYFLEKYSVGNVNWTENKPYQWP